MPVSELEKNADRMIKKTRDALRSAMGYSFKEFMTYKTNLYKLLSTMKGSSSDFRSAI